MFTLFRTSEEDIQTHILHDCSKDKEMHTHTSTAATIVYIMWMSVASMRLIIIIIMQTLMSIEPAS